VTVDIAYAGVDYSVYTARARSGDWLAAKGMVFVVVFQQEHLATDFATAVSAAGSVMEEEVVMVDLDWAMSAFHWLGTRS
jgi:hypothetical protein